MLICEPVFNYHQSTISEEGWAELIMPSEIYMGRGISESSVGRVLDGLARCIREGSDRRPD
jgi:hypothetical protein